MVLLYVDDEMYIPINVLHCPSSWYIAINTLRNAAEIYILSGEFVLYATLYSLKVTFLWSVTFHNYWTLHLISGTERILVMLAGLVFLFYWNAYMIFRVCLDKTEKDVLLLL
jgi:hypothetical protein